MRVLLCLLSQQHVPNLLAVHHYRPDRLILLETPVAAEKRWADHLLDALGRGGRPYEKEVVRVEQEDVLASTRAALQDAHGRAPAADWVVNVTGGTKPMAIAAFQFFSALGARVVYVNALRPDVLLDLTGGGEQRCAYRPSLEEYLAGYGFRPVKPEAARAAAEGRAVAWAETARLVAAHARSDELLAFESEEDRQRAKDKGFVKAADPWRPWVHDEPGLADALATFAPPGGRVDKYQTAFLLGGWLEHFLWGRVRQHRDALGVWDVQLGPEVGRDGSSNDLDVAFMEPRGLVAVECKTGSQAHGPWQDVFYKVEAVKQGLRALGVRTVLVSTSANILDADGGLRDAVRTRAALYDCRVVTLGQVRDLADHADDAGRLRACLGLGPAGGGEGARA